MTENCNEAPKRKRRTKEEIEAAKADGTYKTRAKKAPKEAEDVLEESPKEETYKKPVPPAEQSVLLMACLHPRVAQSVNEAAKQHGVEVVILEDKVIYDYLDSRKEVANKNNLGNFLNDTTNRLQSERNAVTLWAILTGNAPIEQADETVFTRTQVCKMTKLTHSKADNALNSLQIFGMLEYTKGNYEFRLVFDKKRCHATIHTDVMAMAKILNNDIMRYKASIEADNDLTKEQKDEMYRELQKTIDATIEY